MIRILAVGRLKDRRLAELAGDYLLRIGPLAPCTVDEAKDDADLVRRLAKGSGIVIALDERGEDLTSAQLAALLASHGGLTFLVGGPDGLPAPVRARHDRALRLSSCTLTHEWARVLLLEQIYRGLAINRGLPYHRA